MKLGQIWDVVSITPSPLVLDSRARKLYKSASNQGFSSHIISNFGKDSEFSDKSQAPITHSNIPHHGTRNDSLIKRIWKFYKKQDNSFINILFLPLLIFGYIVRILYINFFRIKFFRCRVLIIHEAFFLPIAFIQKIIFKTQIIVDVHDDYRNIISKQNSTIFHRLFKNLFDESCRRILYKIASRRITVSFSLAEELKKVYYKDFVVIRNINSFFLENKQLLQKDLFRSKRPENSIYRGIFIGNNKNSLNLDWLYEDFWDGQNFEFNFFGHGYDSSKLVHNDRNIRFHPAIDFAHDSFNFDNFDFGFIPLNIRDESVKYALPNGFFTLVHAKLPILMPNIIELDSFNKKYNVGMVNEFVSARQVYDDLNILVRNASNLSYKKNDPIKIQNWNVEEKIFIKLLNSLLK